MTSMLATQIGGTVWCRTCNKTATNSCLARNHDLVNRVCYLPVIAVK